MPTNTRELLALIFNLLVKFDSKAIDLADFLSRYFFEDGSYSGSYESFVNAVIKPFRNAVYRIMQNVIEGTLQDPIEAFVEEEEKKEKARKEQALQKEKEEQLLKQENGESIKQIKEILLSDKTKVKEKNFDKVKEEEIILLIDMLANVIESNDKDAINYAFISYKYMVRAHLMLFKGREKRIAKLLEGVINGL